MTDSQIIVQKLWNYCNVLRDDGLSYGDYVEQLTYLLFLKMEDERTRPPYNNPHIIEKEYSWQSLLSLRGSELETHYQNILEELGKRSDDSRLNIIFSRAQNRVQDPEKLRRLIVDLINPESWWQPETDVKGDAYEGLLQKNAEDTKSGAGQYFTPRSLVEAIVKVINPTADERVCDPACGTGGFLLSVHNHVTENYKLTRDKRKKFDTKNLRGVELVDSVTRLCLMNMVLHGIGDITEVPVRTADSLKTKPVETFDIVLTNPPFGTKGSIIYTKAEEKKEDKNASRRDDFFVTTSNKQLNFIQHILSLLSPDGRAAVVVPDNVLFDRGAGETVRRKLLEDCYVHTLLRLPTGVFYAQGVKANVLFFDKRTLRRKSDKKLWIYDLRTNQNFTLKERPLKLSDLEDFIDCYKTANKSQRRPTYNKNNPEGRWRSYSYKEIIEDYSYSLDISWILEESFRDKLDDPDIIAERIFNDLTIARNQIQLIMDDLKITI